MRSGTLRQFRISGGAAADDNEGVWMAFAGLVERLAGFLRGDASDRAGVNDQQLGIVPPGNQLKAMGHEICGQPGRIRLVQPTAECM